MRCWCARPCITGGIDGIALTKLDVLDGFDEIKVCIGYRLDGRELDYLPADANEQAQLRAGLRDDGGLERNPRAARAAGPICRPTRSNMSGASRN